MMLTADEARPHGATARVALVFGGSRGIGAAIAKRLAEDGFAVALTYVANPRRAQEVVAAVEARSGTAIALRADSADADAIRAATAEAVTRLGPLSAVVVNAGVLRLGPIDAVSLDDLDLSLDVNVRGVFLAIQAAVGYMRDGGRVITMGSNTAGMASQGGSVYSMTKAAVAPLVRNEALDLAPRGITVNNVQPGPTETDMTADFVPQLRTRVPLGQVAQPAEIAALVSYLTSDASGYMSAASQKKRRSWSRSRTATPCHGKSASERVYRRWTRWEGRPHPGHAADGRTAPATTTSNRSLASTPSTWISPRAGLRVGGLAGGTMAASDGKG